MSDKRSPEAVARRNAKKRRLRAEKRAAIVAEFKRPISKTSADYRRVRFPAFTEGSKAALRSILTQAVLNTGGRL